MGRADAQPPASDERWGLGATLYGVYRGQRNRWEQNLQLAVPGGDGVSALVVDDFDYGHWRVLGKVGLAWEGDTLPPRARR